MTLQPNLLIGLEDILKYKCSILDKITKILKSVNFRLAAFEKYKTLLGF